MASVLDVVEALEVVSDEDADLAEALAMASVLDVVEALELALDEGEDAA